MKHYLAVIIFLASDDCELYSLLRQIHEKYKDVDNRFLFIFAYANKKTEVLTNETNIVVNNLLYHQHRMALQTLNALEYVVNNFSFDYIIRTNLSTFWLLDKLAIRLQNLSPLNIYGRFSGMQPYCIVGQDLVIPKNIVNELFKQKEQYRQHINQLPKGIAEDRILSDFLVNNCSAEIVKANRHMLIVEQIPILTNSALEDIYNKTKDSHIDHIRIKNYVADNRTMVDIPIITYLLNNYYVGCA